MGTNALAARDVRRAEVEVGRSFRVSGFFGGFWV